MYALNENLLINTGYTVENTTTKNSYLNANYRENVCEKYILL